MWGGQRQSPISFTDAGSNDTHQAEVDWDNDGTYDQTVDPFTTGGSISHTYNAGSHVAKVRITDDDSGADTETTAAVVVNYDVDGFLAPVNNTGHGQAPSVFKYKSTIPLKIQVTDCDGSYPSDLAPVVNVQKLTSNTPSGTDEATSTANPTSGTTMRFSGAPDNIYIYNLATKPLSDPSATYQVTATITETGQTVQTVIGLK